LTAGQLRVAQAGEFKAGQLAGENEQHMQALKSTDDPTRLPD
jgi:hypothetical protein